MPLQVNRPHGPTPDRIERDQLVLHAPLVIHEERRQVLIGKVLDRRRALDLNDLEGPELGGERIERRAHQPALLGVGLVEVDQDPALLARIVHLARPVGLDDLLHGTVLLLRHLLAHLCQPLIPILGHERFVVQPVVLQLVQLVDVRSCGELMGRRRLRGLDVKEAHFIQLLLHQDLGDRVELLLGRILPELGHQRLLLRNDALLNQDVIELSRLPTERRHLNAAPLGGGHGTTPPRMDS
mmetsp:Transcript_84570/g.240311  ORF Transcript_84570/g.240311 Transcript_84570/m.240311 type:complete len:240 (-) Transcript_84570:61-780(-)